jgi:hypothetical protein
MAEAQAKGPAKRGRDDGVPGAAKNTGDDACLLVIPHPPAGQGSKNTAAKTAFSAK